MNIREVSERLVRAAAPALDSDLADHLLSLLDAGEFDIALVSLIEDAPQTVCSDIVDQVEKHYRGSGTYVEREALNAVAKYRQLSTA